MAKWPPSSVGLRLAGMNPKSLVGFEPSMVKGKWFNSKVLTTCPRTPTRYLLIYKKLEETLYWPVDLGFDLNDKPYSN